MTVHLSTTVLVRDPHLPWTTSLLPSTLSGQSKRLARQTGEPKKLNPGGALTLILILILILMFLALVSYGLFYS